MSAFGKINSAYCHRMWQYRHLLFALQFSTDAPFINKRYSNIVVYTSNPALSSQ
jgi:hypothetical protein